MAKMNTPEKIGVPSLGWLIIAVLGVFSVLSGNIGYFTLFALLALALSDR